ncbi:MAG: hypothetical protein ABIJ92_02485 [Candidatus Aenigmatarchaeota archaeon]
MRKGMTLPLRIIVVLIVLLIAAFIVIMVFSGGIGQIQEQVDGFFNWMSGQKLPDTKDLVSTGGGSGGTVVGGGLGATCTVNSDCDTTRYHCCFIGGCTPHADNCVV